MKISSRTLSGTSSAPVKQSDVIVIHTDFANMPPSQIQRYASQIKLEWQKVFPTNTIMVVSNQTSISVLSP